MAHLECESHNFHLLYIDYLQQYQQRNVSLQRTVKETISNNNHIFTLIKKLNMLFHLFSSIIFLLNKITL